MDTKTSSRLNLNASRMTCSSVSNISTDQTLMSFLTSQGLAAMPLVYFGLGAALVMSMIH